MTFTVCGNCSHPMHWKVCGVGPDSTAGPCQCRNDVAATLPAPPADGVPRTAPEWNATRELRIEQGPVVISQTRTDPGDMGEPRVLESDGVTYVTVPSFAYWAQPTRGLDAERLRLLRALEQKRGYEDSIGRWVPDPIGNVVLLDDALAAIEEKA
jgi:hypothetical protein